MTEKRTAACDEHLASALRFLVPASESRPMRVRRLATPDEHFQCACGVPAQWYVRTIKDVGTIDARPRIGHYAQDFGG